MYRCVLFVGNYGTSGYSQRWRHSPLAASCAVPAPGLSRGREVERDLERSDLDRDLLLRRSRERRLERDPLLRRDRERDLDLLCLRDLNRKHQCQGHESSDQLFLAHQANKTMKSCRMTGSFWSVKSAPWKQIHVPSIALPVETGIAPFELQKEMFRGLLCGY